MRTITATEASRGFSDLLDAVQRGETVTVTRGGEVVAEIRPPTRRSLRDLRLDLERHGPRLTAQDAREMQEAITQMRSALLPDEVDRWVAD